MELRLAEYLGYKLAITTLSYGPSVINLTPYVLVIGDNMIGDNVIGPQNQAVDKLINTPPAHLQTMCDIGFPVYIQCLDYEWIKFFLGGVDKLADHVLLTYDMLNQLSGCVNLTRFNDYKFMSIAGNLIDIVGDYDVYELITFHCHD